MEIRNRTELIEYVNRGNKVKYILFWGHQKPKSGVSKTCFSQWYESGFEIDGITYQTAEHYMMAEKARLFGDRKCEQNSINASNPGEAKKVGRSVKGFKEEVWLEKRFSIVVAANMAKFGQNESLKEYILSTNSRVLVEASPLDRIWGIGVAADDQRAENPNLWKGDNLLGFALMEVRERLAEKNA
jgi:ribA/ribD-fused uncharacterized protein